MTDMNRVIINADDFGIHQSVNDAVITAHEQGVLTSTSILAQGPAFDDAAAQARRHPGLGIGVHLCLAGSLPPVLSPREVPTLTGPDGLMPAGYGQFIKKMWTGAVDFRHVYDELDAQIEKVRAAGLAVTHIDSHQHLHMLPPVWKIVQALMKKHGIHRLRVPREAYTFKVMSADPVRILGRDGLTFLSEKAMADVKRLHFTTTDYFWGMVDGGHMTEQHLAYILRRLPFGVHEIMMHPGKKTDELSQVFSWGYHWEEEFAALMSPQIRQISEEGEIEFIHYGQLP